MSKLRYALLTTTGESLADLPLIDAESLDSIDTDMIGFWLIEAAEDTVADALLTRIRQSPVPGIYLRPTVFLLQRRATPRDHLSPADYQLSDIAGGEGISALLSRFEPINRWIDLLLRRDRTPNTSLPLRLLRFLASREDEVAPVPTVADPAGFIYPTLQPLVQNDARGVMELLRYLQQQRVIEGRFVTRAHFCNRCHSAFLNFKETCPQCGTEDLNVDELLHHFRCAHVAELADYRRGEDLVCPKCERHLQQVGVDYDKPSIIYRCKACEHSFQEPNIATTCYSCGHTVDPEHLDNRDLLAYRVTGIGANAAEFGLESLFSNLLESDLKLFPIKQFKDLFQLEKARIARYQRSQSTLVMLHLQDLDQVYMRLGERSRDVFAELVAVFRSVLRQSDVITAQNESVFIVVMTETTPEQAGIALKRLGDGIHALLTTNLDTPLEIRSARHAIGAELDLETEVEAFLQAQ